METLRKVIRFYVEGFREMTVGRTLWAIILIKLFILFAVLKVFFFPDLLAGKSPSEKAGCRKPQTRRLRRPGATQTTNQ